MNLIPNGEYIHYKGKRYKATCLAKNSETLEELVIYKALYGEGSVWDRPKDMFFSKVQVDGKTIDRFRLVKK